MCSRLMLKFSRRCRGSKMWSARMSSTIHLCRAQHRAVTTSSVPKTLPGRTNAPRAMHSTRRSKCAIQRIRSNVCSVRNRVNLILPIRKTATTSIAATMANAVYMHAVPKIDSIRRLAHANLARRLRVMYLIFAIIAMKQPTISSLVIWTIARSEWAAVLVNLVCSNRSSHCRFHFCKNNTSPSTMSECSGNLLFNPKSSMCEMKHFVEDCVVRSNMCTGNDDSLIQRFNIPFTGQCTATCIRNIHRKSGYWEKSQECSSNSTTATWRTASRRWDYSTNSRTRYP